MNHSLITEIQVSIPDSGRVLIGNAPDGVDALLLADVVQSRGGVWLHVSRDDARMAHLSELIAFFAPNLDLLKFPAWDCLPYDRVSPHSDVVAQRIDCLTRLTEIGDSPGKPHLVLTTVNALLQRVPPQAAFADRVLSLAAGMRLEPEALLGFLQQNGYHRSDTVSEPGEYALRGGIIDLFPPGSEQPLRLDFFGDELESIRSFDAMTQKSSGVRETLQLKPVSEVLLEEAAITGFRTGYREAFGAPKEDPLYEAISAGRMHPGMEHWLPLFHDRLETLFDYLPAAPLSLDYQVVESRDARRESIEDFYQARQNYEGVGTSDSWVYRPLPPGRLYLNADEWDQAIAARPGAQLSPFAVPESTEQVQDAAGRKGRDFADVRANPDRNVFEAVCREIATQQEKGRRVFIAAYSDGARERLAGLLKEQGQSDLTAVTTWADAGKLAPQSVGLLTLGLENGFRSAGFAFITEQDILGDRLARSQPRHKRPDNFLTEVSSLEERDYVVHVEHGVGQYVALETLEVGGAPHDCLKVLYHGGDKLFVPVENIDVLSRYGSEDSEVELDRLGGAGWQARKARVKQRLKDIADELIKVAAARETKVVDKVVTPEGLYDEFAARFPYPETEDQLRAIEATLDDLATGRPMDRLVCGDVGFGKTEIALRAAFVAVMSGKQVGIVVPTTLLARQHYRTFMDRFHGLPVEIRQLSRLVGVKEANDTKKAMAAGSVEIVIGTHALLSKSIEFKNLGLLIVDEEQHFGVKQKEQLKKLRSDVHVLTLTATPIPRTMQLAMSGVKEMSLIASPPVDRLAVRTFVLPYDPVIVREAILREHFRGGQIFYVCPRVQDLGELQERLAKLVPEVKVAVAHGQLAPGQLEAVMTDFYDRKYDLLLSTNIVESGLDIPSANTLIIHRSDMFGLAQLYQLRGRVGRSKLRGYAYLTLPQGRLLSTAAEKRLQVMQTLDTLGAGFQLASYDMDIRGAGNLLGEEQSGHIREVGIELYQQMLEEAVANARGGGSLEDAVEEAYSPQINIGTSVLIPESYVEDLSVRLGLYRRLSDLVDRQEIEAFAAELIDRFGALPEEVENLLQIMTIKRLCRDAGIEKLDAGPKGATVAFHNDSFANPEGLILFIQQQVGQVKLRPDHCLVYRRQWDTPAARVRGVRLMLEELAKIARPAEQANSA